MSFRWKIAQFFEIRWWQNYLNKRDKQEYLAWKYAYWTDFLKKTDTHPASGQRVMDVGCGPAGIFMLFKEQAVTALDPLLEAYERELPHFRQSDYPNVRFLCLALEEYSDSSSFDFVYCLNAINHVADLEASFQKLAKMTAPSGTLILTTDAHRHAWLKPIFRLLPGDVLHPHQYDLEEYKAMVEKAGFSIQKTELLKREGIFDYWLIVGVKPVL